MSVVEPAVRSCSSLHVSLVVASVLILSGQPVARGQETEECTEPWIKSTLPGLHKDLKGRLYGQHLVIDPVTRSVMGHWSHPSPGKPLVLSFHGSTGSGKNYVSQIIAENIYTNGLASKFVKTFVAEVNFPDDSKADTYKAELQKTVSEHVQQCGRSMFIFDEVDKMPEGVLDAIKPFLDHYPQVDGVDYRKSIFIFLSNSGGSAITKVMLDHLGSGKIREDLPLRDVEPVLREEVFNIQGGLKLSSIISKGLVSMFIPFLPLERRHIKECIQDVFRHKEVYDYMEQQIEDIADELTYFPPDLKLFSTSGCKRLDAKVDLHRNMKYEL